MNFQKTNCLNCNSDNYRQYDEENGYKLVKCQECGLLYVNPRPPDTEINSATQTGLHWGVIELNANNLFHESALVRYNSILQDFYTPEMLQDKTWLDIGAGNGEFVLALNKFSDNKITAKGTEPNLFFPKYHHGDMFIRAKKTEN